MSRFSTLRSVSPVVPIIIGVFTMAFAVFQGAADVPLWFFPGARQNPATRI